MIAQPDELQPPLLWDTLLRRLPVNLLVFDQRLICQYAAPLGGAVLGRPRDELPGRPAAEILPPAAGELGSVLLRAARDGVAWRDDSYQFLHGEPGDGASRLYCWSIQVDPLRADGFRGVMISWLDALAAFESRREVETLRRQQRERNAALVGIVSDLRNLITPLSGYLQVISRRPAMLGSSSPRALIEQQLLPQIGYLLGVVDRLRHPPIYENDEAD
jgi:hypothetical protein